MNYLAHLFLSGDNDEVMVGNLMEDFIVGRIEHPRNSFLPENIKIGIQLHRLIDSFTDTHKSVSICKSILYEKYHKYASVLVDIFFDHFLAIHWSKYSNEDFEIFRNRVYQNFQKNDKILPEKMKPMINSMISHDWLKNYSEFWGIERALKGISSRTTYESKMEEATEDLKANYEIFNTNFQIFFPLLQKECKNFIEKNNHSFTQSKIMA